ncbi:MAG: 50S ribosomal protein L6 [Candidatus Kapabacteria bacterium]|nr:50S ribosomal protein L6 [Candidatus Kapabacteria bacterium]MDW8011433.1 50S ribosomal protein L6 [Bacteroidota bacterium]
MSRIGKKPLPVPEGVQVEILSDSLRIRGPKGELRVPLPSGIQCDYWDGKLYFSRQSDEKKVKAAHGLARALAASAVQGVTTGFTRTLQIEGIGYRAELRGQNRLLLTIGYSHPVLFIPPEGISIAVPAPNVIQVSGIDKQLVGEVAARIRAIRPPEPYKGKGIRYEGEYIRRKAGKAAGR